MMKSKISLWAIALFSMAIWSCGGETTDNHNTDGPDEVVDTVVPTPPPSQLSWEKDGLRVYALENSPSFPDAKLSLVQPEPNADLAEGKNTFQFQVEGYELGQPTDGADQIGLANSAKGQHIHFILDNDPYSAHYEEEFTKELAPGNHVLLAFLSRSYHESVKAPGAYIIRQFVVGTPEEGYKEADLNAPHMFYSRPKGNYKDGEFDKLMLDFFLLNTDLSPDGNKVRATINGTEFTFTDWRPYVIEGLEAGTATIKLELLDSEGNLVNSPFNPVERSVTLGGS